MNYISLLFDLSRIVSIDNEHSPNSNYSISIPLFKWNWTPRLYSTLLRLWLKWPPVQSSFNGRLKTLVESFFIELAIFNPSQYWGLHCISSHWTPIRTGVALNCVKLLKPRRMVVSTPILIYGRLDADFNFNSCFYSDSRAIKPQLKLNASQSSPSWSRPPTPASICRSDLISLVLAADVVDCCRSCWVPFECVFEPKPLVHHSMHTPFSINPLAGTACRLPLKP